MSHGRSQLPCVIMDNTGQLGASITTTTTTQYIYSLALYRLTIARIQCQVSVISRYVQLICYLLASGANRRRNRRLRRLRSHSYVVRPASVVLGVYGASTHAYGICPVLAPGLRRLHCDAYGDLTTLPASVTLYVYCLPLFYTYNSRLIGSRVWSIEFCHFYQP